MPYTEKLSYLCSAGLLFLLALGGTSVTAAGPGAAPVAPISPDLLDHSSVSPVPETLPESPVDSEAHFLKAAEDFLLEEQVDPKTVNLELKPLRGDTTVGSNSWRALAQVFVDVQPGGGVVRKLVFDQTYWSDPKRVGPAVEHRWTKLMWHEIHHLRFFPKNLQKARQLKEVYRSKRKVDAGAWEHQWILLLEPLEEIAAERECLERYHAAYGPVPDELMEDSRADMLKHAARYKNYLADLLKNARSPKKVLKAFPARLPLDAQGNILPE